MRQKLCADCGFELHKARVEPKRTLPLQAVAAQFVPEVAGIQDAPSSGRSAAAPVPAAAAVVEGPSPFENSVMSKLMAIMVEASTNTSEALVRLAASKESGGNRIHSTMRVQIPTDWPKYGDDGTYDGDPMRSTSTWKTCSGSLTTATGCHGTSAG